MFKKVLLGTDKDLDILEQTQWPELGSSTNRKWTNTIANETNLEEINNVKKDLNKATSSEEQSCSTTQAQSNDFPNLIESMRLMDIDKRNRVTNSEQFAESIQTEKCRKKIRKALSRAPITLDINMMLNLSMALAEKKQNKKCKRLCLNLQKQLSSKMIKSGNKLDSDCPVRHKGKKRSHGKKRKCTKIKISFQRAALKLADQSTTNRVVSYEFRVCMNRFRQSIMTGLDKREPIDDLVNNLDRITLNDIGSDENNDVNITDYNKEAKSLLHTKSFKPYCNHLPNKDLKEKSKELIKTLRTFQDRTYAKDPIKSKAKRRYVSGCREVRKFLRAESVKLLYVANNLSVDPTERPPILEEIFRLSSDFNIPVIFSGTSSDLGLWSLKKSKTSVIGVMNYEGAETLYKDIIEDLNQAQQDYQQLLQKLTACLQNKFRGFHAEMECSSQELEEQIRDNILSKLV